jgi:hypothetical protein
MVLFHKPTCPECQKVVKLVPKMEALNPHLKVILHKNEGPNDVDVALRLKAGTKIPAEGWGPAFVIFTGPAWASPEGQATLPKLHQLLADRLGVKPSEWPSPQLVIQGALGSPLAGLRTVHARQFLLATWSQIAQRCTLFPLALLAGFLFFLGRDQRRQRLVAYPFVAGVMLVFGLLWLGLLTPWTNGLPQNWPEAETFAGLAVVAALLAVRALAQYLRVRKETAPVPIEAPAASPRAATWWLPVAGLLGGVAAGLLSGHCGGATALPTYTMLVNMNLMAPHTLTWLGVYWLLCAVPLLAVAVLAAEVCVSRRSRAWAQAHPADAKQAAFLLFLMLTVILLAPVFAV